MRRIAVLFSAKSGTPKAVSGPGRHGAVSLISVRQRQGMSGRSVDSAESTLRRIASLSEGASGIYAMALGRLKVATIHRDWP